MKFMYMESSPTRCSQVIKISLKLFLESDDYWNKLRLRNGYKIDWAQTTGCTKNKVKQVHFTVHQLLLSGVEFFL